MLARFGGVWADSSLLPLAPLDDFLWKPGGLDPGTFASCWAADAAAAVGRPGHCTAGREPGGSCLDPGGAASSSNSSGGSTGGSGSAPSHRELFAYTFPDPALSWEVSLIPTVFEPFGEPTDAPATDAPSTTLSEAPAGI